MFTNVYIELYREKVYIDLYREKVYIDLYREKQYLSHPKLMTCLINNFQLLKIKTISKSLHWIRAFLLSEIALTTKNSILIDIRTVAYIQRAYGNVIFI